MGRSEREDFVVPGYRVEDLPGTGWFVVVTPQGDIWLNECPNIHLGLGICLGSVEDAKKLVEVAERLLLPEHHLENGVEE